MLKIPAMPLPKPRKASPKAAKKIPQAIKALETPENSPLPGFFRPMPRMDEILKTFPSNAGFMARALIHDVEALNDTLAQLRKQQTAVSGWPINPDSLRRYYSDEQAFQEDLNGLLSAEDVESIVSEQSHSGRKHKGEQLKAKMAALNPDDEKTLAAVRQFMDAYFFLQTILLPCLLVNNDFPQPLYKKALSGELNALADLLRLDKGVLELEPALAKHFSAIQRSSNAAQKSILNKALSASSFDQPRPLALRARISAIIQAILEAEGKSIPLETLFNLFHAASKDRRMMDDPHMPDSLPTFRQAVSRERKAMGG